MNEHIRLLFCVSVSCKWCFCVGRSPVWGHCRGENAWTTSTCPLTQTSDIRSI